MNPLQLRPYLLSRII